MKKNGTVKILNGEFIVEDPVDGGAPAILAIPQFGSLIVNGNDSKGISPVYSKDIIKYNFKNKPMNREILLEYGESNMSATISFLYEDEISYIIRDNEAAELLEVQLDEIDRIPPPFFTPKEIMAHLTHNRIIFGIKKELLELLSKTSNVQKVLIAEGVKPIDAKDDSITFSFDDTNKPFDINSIERINYRDLNKLHTIKSGDIIGIIERGYDSIDGTNIFGSAVGAKKKKRKIIDAGSGCKVICDLALATVNGLVNFKNFAVSVSPIYKTNDDIDLEHGNVNFLGHVVIGGSVTEGMSVTGSETIEIDGGVYKGVINSGSDIYIKGNSIGSSIIAGQDGLYRNLRIQSYNSLKTIINDLLSSIQLLKGRDNVYGEDVGLLIKTLLETKFRDAKKVFSSAVEIEKINKSYKSDVVDLINDKLLYRNVTKIKSTKELKEILGTIEKELLVILDHQIEPSHIKLTNCQESTIKASGNVIIAGKGVFISDIESLNAIIFENNNAVVRGGYLKADKYISVGKVGSEAGGRTTVEVVSDTGQIEIGIAYDNTLIILNNKRFLVNKAIRNVRCFINENDELIVDRIYL